TEGQSWVSFSASETEPLALAQKVRGRLACVSVHTGTVSSATSRQPSRRSIRSKRGRGGGMLELRFRRRLELGRSHLLDRAVLHKHIPAVGRSLRLVGQNLVGVGWSLRSANAINQDASAAQECPITDRALRPVRVEVL